MIENSVFHWDRPVPEEWAAQVAQLAPRTDRASHLALFWEAGSPSEPVQRWVLYEATPVNLVQPWRLGMFLADPPCRCSYESRALDRCPRCGGMQSPGRTRILRYLQQTECLALPFWVIQGHDGGHRTRYSQVEQQWAALARKPTEPPDPGSLAYAPFDQRVIRKVRQLDRARWAHRSLAEAAKHEKVAAEQDFRRALSDYLDLSVASAFDELSRQRRANLIDELPRHHTADRLTVDTAEARDTFITTGKAE